MSCVRKVCLICLEIDENDLQENQLLHNAIKISSNLRFTNMKNIFADDLMLRIIYSVVNEL